MALDKDNFPNMLLWHLFNTKEEENILYPRSLYCSKNRPIFSPLKKLLDISIYPFSSPQNFPSSSLPVLWVVWVVFLYNSHCTFHCMLLFLLLLNNHLKCSSTELFSSNEPPCGFTKWAPSFVVVSWTVFWRRSSGQEGARQSHPTSHCAQIVIILPCFMRPSANFLLLSENLRAS